MKFITKHLLSITVLITTILTITSFAIRPTVARATGSCVTDSFCTTWQTTSDGESITIPTYVGETYNYDIDWGDGNTDTAQVSNITHTYVTAGTYTVSITGTFPRIYFNDGASLGAGTDKIIAINQWGNIQWASMENAFSGCSNLAGQASDTPDLSGVTDTSNMFFRATLFNQDINSWNVSHVTNMNNMFGQAESFNQPLNTWDTSHVTIMSFMFSGATVFNQNISSWDVSHVTDFSEMFSAMDDFNQPLNTWDTSSALTMMRMFYQSGAFNQPLNNFDTSHVTDLSEMFLGAVSFNQNINTWDTSAVTTMHQTFSGATSFNQPLNSWNTSHVTDMSVMFRDAASFNQPLNYWNTSNVESMLAMFVGATSFDQDISSWDVSHVIGFDFGGPYVFLGSGKLSRTNYDLLLSSWSQQSLQSGLSLNMGDSTYCSSETQRASIISNHNWIITDGGKDCPATVTTTVSSGQGAPWRGSSLVAAVAPTQPLSPPLPITRTLKQKSTGPDVRLIQSYLNTHGYGVTVIGKETTYFGPKTKAAVIQFQKANGLTPDGVVGSATKALMI